jgi:Group 4 capsule polysaccharide lipoprotein gfcB, YjbF
MPRFCLKPYRALTLVLTAGLAGCGSSGNFTYRQYGNLLGQAFRSSFAHASVPREAVAAIPYATMGYRLNGGDEAVLVLATKTEQSELWTASSHVVFQTSHGRITRTVGLPRDLGGLTPQDSAELPPLSAALKAPFTSRRFADLPQGNIYGLPITCTTVAGRPETIVILGQALSAMRVDENCESRQLNWRFVDNYWLDPKTGYSWRSHQHLSPEGETVDTEIFRPPG